MISVILLFVWKTFVFLFVLGALIFVHELGHFLVAKWSGVGVLKFSLGFGPTLFRIRRGETQYQVSIIPLGGYVRLVGDMPDIITGPEITDQLVRDETSLETTPHIEDEFPGEELAPEAQKMIQDRKRWFVVQSLPTRFAIVFAGPLFNLLFAFVLVFCNVAIFGEEVPDDLPKIGMVMKGLPAEQAGLQIGDEVLSIQGTRMGSWKELASRIHDGPETEMAMIIKRDNEPQEVVVKPLKKEILGPEGKPISVYIIGIGPTSHREKIGIGDSLNISGRWCLNASVGVYQGLWGMLTGKISPKELAGPLYIFDVASEQAKEGIEKLLIFMAFLSLSLAVLNLLPIPVLDGGHLFFFVLEALIGPISVKKKEIAQQVGVAILVGLMVLAIRNDITRKQVQKKSDSELSVEK